MSWSGVVHARTTFAGWRSRFQTQSALDFPPQLRNPSASFSQTISFHFRKRDVREIKRRRLGVAPRRGKQEQNFPRTCRLVAAAAEEISVDVAAAAVSSESAGIFLSGEDNGGGGLYGMGVACWLALKNRRKSARRLA